ncbi:MAG: TolC family outer membrane protein [Alphaproteobacteria bacterium]
MKFNGKYLITLILLKSFLTPALVSATTLEEALIQTYNTNPNMLADREESKANDEVIIQAIAEFLPNISSGIRRSKNFSNAKISNENLQKNLYDRTDYTNHQEITLEQSLFNGGASLLQIKIAKKFIEASRAQLAEKEQKVFLNAINAYINVLSTAEKVKIYQNSVELLKKHLESIEDRFALNDVTRTDLGQAKARFSQSLSELTKAQGAHTNAKNTYEAIVGLKAENLETLKDIEDTPPSLDDAIKLSLVNNPSIISARLMTDIEANKILQNVTRFAPRVTLQASLSRDISPNYSYSYEVNRPIEIKTRNKQATINLELPLYQKGLEYQAVRKQKHLYQKSKNELQAENNKLINETMKTWEDINLYNSILKASIDGIESATIALEGVTQEAQLGQRTTLDVLETEQELLKSQLTALDARYNKIMNIYALKSHLGILTARSMNLSTTIYDPKVHYDKIKFKIIGF